MKKLIAMLALTGVFALAQTTTPETPVPQKPAAKSVAKPAQRLPGSKASISASVKPGSETPTQETVNAFMHRMFGQEPNIKWEIVDISATDAPGVSHVAVALGPNKAVTEFYVLPGGKSAIVGELIPFGADPFAAAREKLAKDAHGPSRGSQAPAVTLVEFSDLQCPHCKEGQPIIDKLMADVPNAKLIFEPFPLPMHPWAALASQYAECVAQQKPPAFWTFIQSVYDAQAGITEGEAPARLVDLAEKAGIDAAAATTCANSPEAKAKVDRSKELGLRLGVNSTPTLFINGRKITSLKEAPYDSLKAIAEFEAKGGK